MNKVFSHSTFNYTFCYTYLQTSKCGCNAIRTTWKRKVVCKSFSCACFYKYRHITLELWHMYGIFLCINYIKICYAQQQAFILGWHTCKILVFWVTFTFWRLPFRHNTSTTAILDHISGDVTWQRRFCNKGNIGCRHSLCSATHVSLT